MKGSKTTKSTTKKYKEQIKENFPDLLTANYCLINLTCKKAGIDKSTYYMWRKKDPEFAKRCDDVKELIGDVIESKLYDQARGNVLRAIEFLCRTKYKDRGYVERIDQNVTQMTHEEWLEKLKEIE